MSTLLMNDIIHIKTMVYELFKDMKNIKQTNGYQSNENEPIGYAPDEDNTNINPNHMKQSTKEAPEKNHGINNNEEEKNEILTEAPITTLSSNTPSNTNNINTNYNNNKDDINQHNNNNNNPSIYHL